MSGPKSAGSFQTMGLESDLFKGLNRIGYKNPTPVQRKALPIALAGIDIVCMSRTGSGKSCVFLVPLLQKLKSHNKSGGGVRAVILSPTRELAVQTFKLAKDMGKFMNIKFASLVGGDSIDGQFDQLADNPDVIIGTPGRLMHLLREVSTFNLKNCSYLVFDEADRLFEMGFSEQLNEIIRECPTDRQTLLFSATLPKQLVQFTRAGLKEPQFIRLEAEASLSAELRCAFLSVRSNEKLAAFLYLVRTIIPRTHFTIVFVATKHHSELLHALIQHIGLSSTMIYGSMDQDSRNSNLRRFRNGEVHFLIVTDVAARGIDIPLLNNVINFHFPTSPKLFIHRCGRAARQGRTGFAFSLVDPDEWPYAADVHKFLDFNLRESVEFDSTLSYTLETMTPKNVHSGSVPQDVLDEENEWLRQLFRQENTLQKLFDTSENGMQQYKRTRIEASKDGVKAAKDALKIEGAKALLHPLLVGVDPTRCNQSVVEKNKFVHMLQTFRPHQTVLESGIGTGCTSGSTSRNKSVQRISAGKEVLAGEAMRAFRKVTRFSLERNKRAQISNGIDEEEACVEREVDDSDEVRLCHQEPGDDGSEGEIGVSDEFDVTDDHDNICSNNAQGGISGHVPRLSKAARRKQKANASDGSDAQMTFLDGSDSTNTVTQSGSSDRAESSYGSENRFHDTRHFMTYGTEDDKADFMESAMQPLSGMRGAELQGTAMMQKAVLDLSPEGGMAESSTKKKILRWDPKKRKFIKQTLEEMTSTKRLRSEASAGAVKSTSSKPQGEIYEKWKKKRHREIGSEYGVGGEDDGGGNRGSPNFKHNSKVKSELRNSSEIRKLKSTRENNKVKNRKRDSSSGGKGKRGGSGKGKRGNGRN